MLQPAVTDNLTSSDQAYIETDLAEDKSIFDWSLRLKAPELIEGVRYNKSIVKSSHGMSASGTDRTRKYWSLIG